MFSKTLRTVLGPSQPPIQLVPGFTRGLRNWCVKLISHLHPVLRLRMSGAMHPFSYAHLQRGQGKLVYCYYYYYYYYPCYHLYSVYFQLYTQTTHVTTVYSATAVLYLQFVLHVMLFRMLNMFCTFTSALPAVCVQCTIRLFFAVP